ncbi:tRNA lysidine(34) synthetase TilS [Rossellomorea vietnamensis]|uniref:tRNA(Ile)-lysidine synthase n=1 Tax=Rossellomorea vietnamensis TaxID=218284 RepID=A0A5D4NL86_9BACI|nr:tRNA lysidine(34) synthetase TilS [Rossellomorea vietnamensis]TYS13672.1 tRNA lysidine(34) synthetase TilS [Rossellomorea vietnamensis]
MFIYERKVLDFIRKHNLIQEGDSILAAVSGGPDSLSLLYFLDKYKRLWNAKVAAVCVDHMFRGEESYEEFLFVQDLCGKMGIPFYGERVNVQEILKERNEGLQEGARNIRYSLFAKLVNGEGFTKLAFGHHGDDQVETILMRMTRGSSMARSGIPVTRDFHGAQIIRPLLCLEKPEILAYCSESGLEPKHDPSNEKRDYTRNRFRHEVLPFLKGENPLVHLKFQQFSEEAAEDEALLQTLAQEKMESILTKVKDEAIVDIKGFRLMPLPLQRRVIHLILNYLYKDRPSSLSSIHIQDVLAIIMKDSPSLSLDLPGNLKAIRSYNQCIFTFGGRAEESGDFCYTLNIGESVELPDHRIFILQEAEEPGIQADSVIFQKVSIALPLRIRTRKPGDRMKVKGLNGTKKVKDIFIDEKIPVILRDNWPLVTDDHGEILWVPNLKKSVFVCYEPGDPGEHVRLIYSQQTSS